MEVTTGSPEAEYRTSPQRHPPFMFGTGVQMSLKFGPTHCGNARESESLQTLSGGGRRIRTIGSRPRCFVKPRCHSLFAGTGAGVASRATAFARRGITQTPSSSKQSVSLQISPSFPEKPGFSASVGRMPEGAVGRDAQVQQHRAEEPVVSLSGDISVPQCRRCGSRRWGRRRQARLRRSRLSDIDKA